MQGKLAAIVGASGVGKDTLLGAVRRRLVDDKRFTFVKRVITRPAEESLYDNSERHMPVTTESFDNWRVAGRFALHWQAHGLQYGLLKEMESELNDGKIVIANLSRAILHEVPPSYRMQVIIITAPIGMRAERLHRRGREAMDDIVARLERSAKLPDTIDAVQIVNNSTPDEGAERLMKALLDLC